ncbi:MAG: hypothetical protein MUC93_08785 [Bacteroidales bacterium]|jgi:glycosyltransferase involved in cell wall biosynthesis|nr:hypothetical protein [Bacteroidales bacterium]
MSDLRYPKVLIIGEPFNNIQGGGITMKNLFQNWPIEKIALASDVNLQYNLDTSICKYYFQLGYNGKLHPFPLSLILTKLYCGPISYMESLMYIPTGNIQKPGRYKTIYNLLRSVMNFTGVYNFLYKIKITNEFKKWVINFNPDVIYSQLSTLALIRLVQDIHDLSNKPVALHIMDDWPVTINKPGLLSKYWEKVIDREFRQLIDNSVILMSICDAMSEEYKLRYKREFIPFHNPIEVNKWLPFTKKDWSVRNKFTILYAGRIGLGMKQSIKDIARVVTTLSLVYYDIIFEIQTRDISELKGLVKFSDNVRRVDPIAYEELPKKFSSVDLLLLPIDFDIDSINFLRFSFPTKITEYMISGTPILLYAPAETATTEYAIKDKWAFTVTERNDKLLYDAIERIYSDPDLRRDLGERARDIAVSREDADLVRDNFRKMLTFI